jgi:3-phosphoshikimate 1-carboxyvinyltransferase
LKINSKKSTLTGTIDIPGSKSHSIRAIAIATMSEGKSVLRGVLDSADTRSAMNAAEAFGAKVVHEGIDLIIEGIGKSVLPENVLIDVGNSGTTLRIFTALAAVYNQKVTFDGDKSIRQRPMTSLLNALRMLDVKIDCKNDKCPFTVQGPMKGGTTRVDGISSQFLTAMLFASPLCNEDIIIEVENLHEQPYVSITLDWLNKQNIRYSNRGLDYFEIPGNQEYSSFDSRIPADFSSATFALVAAAVTQSKILIEGLDFSDHQGDKKVFQYLRDMGMQIEESDKGIWVSGTELNGIDIDMNDTPDALPAMAVAGCFAKGTTRLLNVKQARLKECDRISAIATELNKMGGKVTELSDGLVIQQASLKGAHVHGYDDHRMVMSLAIAGFGATGDTIIDTAEAINITYPTFIDDMIAIGANISTVE